MRYRLDRAKSGRFFAMYDCKNSIEEPIALFEPRYVELADKVVALLNAPAPYAVPAPELDDMSETEYDKEMVRLGNQQRAATLRDLDHLASLVSQKVMV